MATDAEKSCTSHVVLLDDERNDGDAIAELLKGCFSRLNLTLRIDVLRHSVDVAKHLAKHPDVFFCDVSLEGRDDIKGLNLIANAKKKFPDVAFAAMTANLEQLEKLDQITTMPDYIVPKRLLIPDADSEYEKRIVEIILRNTRQNRYFKLVMEKEVEATIKKAFAWATFDRDAVECLIRQVFSTNVAPPSSVGSVNVERFGLDLARNLIQEVHVRQFETGRSGSPVFLAHSKIDQKDQDVSVVLKFCEANAFESELHNYARFVKWTLPHAWRVDVLGTGRTHKHGVIGYSLAFAGASDAQPLAQFVRDGNAERIKTFIAKAFDPDQKVWYRNPRVEQRNLQRVLMEKHFHDRASYNTRLREAIDKIVDTTSYSHWNPPESSKDKRLLLTRQIDRVMRHEWKPYNICICHGDLHAGNVMMSKEGSGTAFIDFQDTGLHHVFTDFVFFENALRKDGAFSWGGANEMLAFERAEIDAALADSLLLHRISLPEGLSLVRNVRKQAFANFEESRAYYFLHALMFSLLMISNESSSPTAVERLSSFIIACVGALDAHLQGKSA